MPGSTPDHLPQTWDQVQQAASRSPGPPARRAWRWPPDNATKSDFLTQRLINSNGRQLLSPDGHLQLASGSGVGALSMLSGLASSGAAPKITDNDAVSAFTGMSPEATRRLVERILPEVHEFPSRELLDYSLVELGKLPIFGACPPLAEGVLVEQLVKRSTSPDGRRCLSSPATRSSTP